MRSKKNLVIFTGSFPFGKGENFIEQELIYCAEKFENITIIPLYYGTSKIPRHVPESINFIKPILSGCSLWLLGKGIFNLAPVIPFLKELFQSGLLNKNRLLRWLRISAGTRILLRSKVVSSLLNNNNSLFYFYWGTGAAYLLPFIKNKKSVVRLHGSDLYEESNLLFFRKEIYTCASQIITISEFGKKYLIERYPQFSNKISIFKLGTKDFGSGKQSIDSIFRIVSCSSVIALKRVDAIAKSLKPITEKQIIWTHIGTGPLLKVLEKDIALLPKNIKVTLSGYKSNKEIMYFYSTEPIDLFINVSFTEGLPVSIMEAYSFGIPAIATNVGGTSEIVDSENGILLDKNFKISQLTDAIRGVISGSLSEKSQNARLKWEKNHNASVNFNIFTQFLIEISNA